MATSDYITISLTQNQNTIMDIEDSDLDEFNWTARYDKEIGNYYVQRSLYKKSERETVFIHRVILSRMLNRELSSKEKVDHINRNTLDNRRSNLRLANSSQNSANRKMQRNNKVGFKGVTRWRKKYRAGIRFNGKAIYLGLFDTPELAHAAYCGKAKELFGEFFNAG